MLEADPHIIRTAAAGDHRAFEVLVRTYQEPVVRFLAHLLSDRALADDVAQETFLRCYQKLDGYSFEGRFSTWLLRVAHNAGIDAIRGRVRRERLGGAARDRRDRSGAARRAGRRARDAADAAARAVAARRGHRPALPRGGRGARHP